ncbi:MAG: dephospho-CoA kinase [Betaproteobacteria bacterium]|nr:dephospho-CoA kinase [Betaproteobacteria bacterium]
MSAAPSARFVVGLTGGIGAGKSAAAEEFARLGATVVDTDAIAHELTAPGGAALPEIEKAFGRGFIGATGAMDRAKMRAHVFAQPAARRLLEGILHPMIREESERRIAAAAGPYVVHVIPLLVESGEYRRRVDRVLVVDAPESDQVARVRSRGLSEEAARAILASQAARADRLAAADDVLENAGSLEDLRRAVRALHEKYLQFAGP